MFWKETKGLSSLPASSRIALTLFLLVAGLGYLLGFFNIYLTYSPVDQKPGLSVADIRIAFWGERGATRLEKAVNGSMKEHFASDGDLAKVTGWLAAGAKEDAFVRDVKPIFDSSCSSCHSTEARIADVVTVSYADVRPLLAQDTGKPLSRLVALSHTHVLATLPVLFILALIFSFSRFGERLKTAVMAFGAVSIVIDVGTWWLAKLSGALAVLVLLGGLCLAFAFLFLIVLSLYDLWLRKPEA